MIITQLPNTPNYIFTCTQDTSFFIHEVPKELSNIIILVTENNTCTFVMATKQSTTITLNVTLAERNSHFKGLFCFMLSDNTQVTLNTQQTHSAPETTSNLLVKSIVYDSAKSIYNGIITIIEDALQADAAQNSYALLLSPDAQAYANPSLEVLNHEVQCSHGAAVASLDLEHLFYIQSRGLGKERAEHLIIQSFFVDIVDYPQLCADFLGNAQT